jgi:hypothetical protein
MRTVKELFDLAMQDLRTIPGTADESTRVMCVVNRVQQEVMSEVLAIVKHEYDRWMEAETDDLGIEIGAVATASNIYCRLMGLHPSTEEEIKRVTNS